MNTGWEGEKGGGRFINGKGYPLMGSMEKGMETSIP